MEMDSQTLLDVPIIECHIFSCINLFKGLFRLKWVFFLICFPKLKKNFSAHEDYLEEESLFDVVPAARKIPKLVEQQRPPISERIQLVRKREGRPIITLDGRKLTLSGSGGRKLNIGGKGAMKKGKGGGRGLSILERISF